MARPPTDRPRHGEAGLRHREVDLRDVLARDGLQAGIVPAGEQLLGNRRPWTVVRAEHGQSRLGPANVSGQQHGSLPAYLSPAAVGAATARGRMNPSIAFAKPSSSCESVT